MGQVAFSIAGAVIGNFIAPGVGGAIGGALGSALGGALFPTQLPTIEGPQLEDKNIQVSTYGKAIPIAYGTVRMAGNVIWSTPLRETRTEEEQGGSGGGPVQTTVSYTYDVDVAIAIGEGEIDSIRRLWVNGILVWDARPVDDPTLVAQYGGDADAILRARSGSEIMADAFVFYHGEETQLPDPTIEATEGAGNVPAYRGVSYVVLTRFQLARWGNRMPQFEFEVVTDGTQAYGTRVAAEHYDLPQYRSAPPGYNQSAFQPIVSDISEGIRVFSASQAEVDPNVRVYGYDATFKSKDIITDWEADFTPLEIGPPDVFVWVMFDGGVLHLDTVPLEDLRVDAIDSSVSITELLAGSPIGGVAPCADGRHLMAFEYSLVNPYPIIAWHLVKYLGNSQAEIVDSGSFTAFGDTQYLNMGWGPINQRNGHFQTCMLEGDLRHMWRTSGNHVELWTRDAVSGIMALDIATLNGDFASLNITGVSAATPVSICCDNGFCAIVAGDDSGGHWVYVYSRLVAITATAIILGDIVADLCERVGLTPAQIDVSDLTTEVRGFVINTAMSARAAIEALMRAFNFDGAESGDQLIFRLRGATPVLTLTEDDIGASDGGNDAVLVISERGQENELPAEVAVLYMDANADFARGAQAVRRMATQSVQKEQHALPVVMTPDEAAQAAEMLLYQSWVGRNKRTFATTRAFSHIEPCDVVALVTADLQAVVRIMGRRQTDGLLEWTAVDVDSSAFEPNALGSALPPPRGISILAPSHIHVLDIPALRADDDDAGVYIAVYHPGSGAWAGAAILSASSPAGPFARVSSVYTSAIVGAATTVLGDYFGGNTFDELNTVTVRMFNSAPESATRDDVLNGANAAVLGDEIIQWTTATDLGDDLYELSGLLRGRRATEQQIGSHAVSDRFVVLDSSLVRLPLGNGVIGTRVVYRAVTFGATEQNPTFDDQVRHIGASVIPALVANVQGVRTDAGVLFTWDRRDRLAWEWQDEIELPLSEDLERYTIEIFTGSAGVPIRIENDITESQWLYQAVYEEADFGIIEGVSFPIAYRTVKVYQMSQQVGRGFSEEITVTGLLNY